MVATTLSNQEYWDFHEALELLRAARAHVYRQQHDGLRHEQDRIDAKELFPKIDDFLSMR